MGKKVGKKTKEIEGADTEEQALMRRIRERAVTGKTYWQENWNAAETDLLFLDGEHWTAAERAKREKEGRPVITNNILPSFVDAVLGEARQARSSIKILQTGYTSGADIAKAGNLTIQNIGGTKDYKLDEALEGLIGQIEYNSDAETAYDSALENSVSSSLGFLRVYSDWAHDNSFDQVVLIKNIDNQFNVILDPLCEEFDYSDATWCIVDSMMSREEFKARWPDANASHVGLTDPSIWMTDHAVRVSEYFERESYKTTMHAMSDGTILEDKNYQAIGDELAKRGVTSIHQRDASRYRVTWRKVNAHQVLEGPVTLPCSTIPIVPVLGKRLVIKDRKKYKSLIRNSLDAVRQANYFESSATESVALSPKSPFIASAHHVEDNLKTWENANQSTDSVLVYKPMHDGDPGPRRQPPAMVPAAEITMGLNAIDKVKATIGMYDASLGAAGNETSGKAIIARQRQGDRGSFAFIDNLKRSKRRVGKLIVEWIINTYDSERVEKLRFADGSEDYITINQMIRDEQTGRWYKVNDFSVGSFEVIVDTGPSYATQRAEAADTMIALSQTIPSIAPLIADLIVANLDISGAEEIAARIRKTQPLEMLNASQREEIIAERAKMAESEGQQQPAPPSPDVMIKDLELQVAQAKLQAEEIAAQAKAARAEVDILLAELKVKAANSQAGNADELASNVRMLVAEAIGELAQGGPRPAQVTTAPH